MERYTYQVYDGDTLVFEGSAKAVREKYYISCLSSYTEKGVKMCGQYNVIKKPLPYKPCNNDTYYYYSTLTERVQKDYWKDSDTNCLLRWNAGNVFKYHDLARKYGHDNMLKIMKRFAEC